MSGMRWMLSSGKSSRVGDVKGERTSRTKTRRRRGTARRGHREIPSIMSEVLTARYYCVSYLESANRHDTEAQAASLVRT